MAAETINVPYNQGGSRPEMIEQRDTGLGVARTTAVRLVGPVTVQLTGTATSVTATTQRSTKDPSGTANWAPADDTAFTGDLTAGVAARSYEGAGSAWWSVNITAASGGTVDVSIMGQKAI